MLLLHAGIADSRMWAPQVEGLASDFDLIRPDLRGYGKTPLPPEPYSQRADLLALLDQLGLGEVAIVGCSMAGAIALDFTLEHPARVDALVLIGSGISGARLARADADLFGEADAAEEAGDLEAQKEAEVRLWLDGPERPAGYVGGEIRGLVLAMNGAALRTDWESAEELPLDPPAVGRLTEIGVPTLVIVGDHDLPHVHIAAQMLVDGIPAAKLAAVADSAHLPSLEHPELVNQLLLDFLRRPRPVL